ncbi:hypothetical protein QYF36_026606 [Acer negundo]|nr:hypothetical protein QYF36_026606 [Acer negundo]
MHPIRPTSTLKSGLKFGMAQTISRLIIGPSQIKSGVAQEDKIGIFHLTHSKGPSQTSSSTSFLEAMDEPAGPSIRLKAPPPHTRSASSSHRRRTFNRSLSHRLAGILNKFRHRLSSPP